MALADTGKAIGAVSQLLRDHLLPPTVPVNDVTIGRPEAAATTSNPTLNLFLYEILFDPNLRNQPLDRGQSIPLWLVLKYLLTAFDSAGSSDSIEAHGFLGEGIRALKELSFLPLIGSTTPLNARNALKDNPEALKITFDQTPSDLLSKLMQGTDEKYRCSVSFEVRPVLITTREQPSYSLLVGIDYKANQVIGAKGVRIPVLPSMGPTITDITPTMFEAGATLTIRGRGLELSTLTAQLGTVELTITERSPNALQCLVNGNISGGTVLSAGSYPVCVAQTLPNGRRRPSNLLVATLLPTLATVSFALDPDPDIFGNLNLTGVLLGSDRDDVFVALYQDGKTVKLLNEFVPTSPPTPPQTGSRFPIQQTDAVPAGTYRVILRVNGQQARNSPEVAIP
jgi:Pvc16 N-terminal domain/IPT/TIG domain